MATALRPSQPPARPPLRAKSLGRLRHPERMRAREATVHVLRRASVGVANGDLGEHLGGEQAGAQVREGALVLTPGEVALLLPLRVALRASLDLLRQRIERELAVAADEVRGVRLRLALSHVDAVLVCLTD